MTFEEAIKTAIELEKKVQGLYVHAADEAADPVGKRVFCLLASEERNHVVYLEKHLAQWQASGKLQVAKLDTVLPSKETIAREVAKLKTKMEGGDTAKELALLEKAREVEMETSSFYKQTVADLDGDGREFFKSFVQAEEGHLALVEAEINAVTGMGFWFDTPEFNLENA